MPLAAETYLGDPLRLDINDPDALMTFTETYGVLTQQEWVYLPLVAKLGVRDNWTEQARTQLVAARPELDDPERWRRRSFFHVGEVAAHLRALRAMVNFWVAFRNDDAPGELINAWEREGFNTVDLAHAWRNFDLFTNAALRDFHVRVYVEDTGLQYQQPLYSALVLQFVNHVAEQAEYRLCANEAHRDRKLFVRQQGRALHGQYRSEGVRFCSPACAKAQTQREYRRRKRVDGGSK